MNGSQCALNYSTGKELIQKMVTDDSGPPPRCMVIEATTEDGKKVTISVPYDDRNRVTVSVED